MKSWWWNFTEFQYQTWQCVFGVGWQHHEDSTTSLSACIPYRLYGDGAEAQRISSEVNQLLFQNCHSLIQVLLGFLIHHWLLNLEGSRSSKCSQCSFPDARPRPTLDCRILHHGCIRKGNGFVWCQCFFPYLVGSPKCALRLSVMNATYGETRCSHQDIGSAGMEL